MSVQIKTEKVHVKVSDGTTMMVYVAKPAKAEKAPGLFVLQEAFGVNSHIRDVTERFAREGFVAAAPELFHRTAAEGFEGSYSDFQSVMPHFQAMTLETLEADLRATYDLLKKDSQVASEKIASVGYCLGGRASFLANGKLPLKAAVSYYGSRIAPELLSLVDSQSGPLLLVWGGKDAHIGPEVRRALNDALHKGKKPFIDVEFSEADHGFFCDQKPSYHEKASKEAWALTLAFLKNNLEF